MAKQFIFCNEETQKCMCTQQFHVAFSEEKSESNQQTVHKQLFLHNHIIIKLTPDTPPLSTQALQLTTSYQASQRHEPLSDCRAIR